VGARVLASLRNFQYPGIVIACFAIGLPTVVFHRWFARVFLAAGRSVGREPRFGERSPAWMTLLVGVGLILTSIGMFIDQIGRP